MKTVYKTLVVLSILVHYIVFVAFIMSSIVSFHIFPWYIAVTMGALIARVIFSRDACPLTTVENVYRQKVGMTISKGFLKEYILHPRKTVTLLIQQIKG